MNNHGAIILVAVNELEIIRVLRRSLTAHDYTVFMAKSGEEAMSGMWYQRPDLLLLDFLLPDMSGLEVCRQVREVWNVPIILSSKNKEGSTSREVLVPFANWLYVQTQGQPLYLIETLKGLLAREIMLPALQENGSWGLVLRADRLAHTPIGDLIPSSVRELIRSQLGRLTPSTWTLLVAGAVLRQGLTFERLCWVAQLDEQEGLRALEEVLRSGLLHEGTLIEEAQAVHGHAFPGEMIREVMYQEAGETRQRLVQQRVLLVIREEAEGDHEEECHLPHTALGVRQTFAETRNGHGRRLVARAVSGEMHRAVTSKIDA